MRAENLLGPDSRFCPTRVLIDQLDGKWASSRGSPSPSSIRFNALRRDVEGITQKILGQTLRKQERNGLVRRQAFATMPITVKYSLTDMGVSLLPIIEDLRSWSMSHLEAVMDAQMAFDDDLDGSDKS